MNYQLTTSIAITLILKQEYFYNCEINWVNKELK